MLPYIITFIFTFILLNISIKKRRSSTIGLIISSIPLILLAAFRSDKVGSDMDLYIIPAFDYACSYNSFKEYSQIIGLEYLYSYFTYLCSRISEEPELYLGLMNAFVVIPILLSTYRLRNYCSTILMFFLFCMFLYNHSFNMQRQSIAISFSFLSFSYYINRKYLIGLLILLIGYFFHKSAFIGLIIPFLLWFTEKFTLRKHKLLYTLIIITTCLIVQSLTSIALYFGNSGFLSEKYDIYFNNSVFKAGISMTDLLLKFITLYIVLKAQKNSSKDDRILDFVLIVSIVDIILAFSGFIVNFLARIGWYTSIISIFSIPYCIKGNTKRTYTFFIISLYIVYWFYMFGIAKVSDTVPYVFR